MLSFSSAHILPLSLSCSCLPVAFKNGGTSGKDLHVFQENRPRKEQSMLQGEGPYEEPPKVRLPWNKWREKQGPAPGPREVRVKPAVSRDGLDPGIAEQTPSPPPLSNELLLQPLTLCFGGVRCPRVVAPREPSGSLLQTIKDTCLCHEDKNSQSATLGEDHMGEEGGGSHGDM